MPIIGFILLVIIGLPILLIIRILTEGDREKEEQKEYLRQWDKDHPPKPFGRGIQTYNEIDGGWNFESDPTDPHWYGTSEGSPCVTNEELYDILSNPQEQIRLKKHDEWWNNWLVLKESIEHTRALSPSESEEPTVEETVKRKPTPEEWLEGQIDHINLIGHQQQQIIYAREKVINDTSAILQGQVERGDITQDDADEQLAELRERLTPKRQSQDFS